MMKIAVPTRNENVDDHFGHCDHYTIYTIDSNVVVSKEIMTSPQGCGCKSGVAADLQEIGVKVMLAGNMGEGAKNKLESHDIMVVRGCSGNVDALIDLYLKGEISDSGVGCSSHGEEHQCGNHVDHSNIKLFNISD